MHLSFKRPVFALLVGWDYGTVSKFSSGCIFIFKSLRSFFSSMLSSKLRECIQHCFFAAFISFHCPQLHFIYIFIFVG